MEYAVLLYFDNATDRRLQILIDDLVASGVNDHYRELKMRPHLTLAVISVDDDRELKEFIADQANKLEPLPVKLASVGMFPTDAGVVFLSPVVNEPLLQMHRQINEKLEQLSGSFSSLYREENWVPHCTLALDLQPDEVKSAYKVLKNNFQPFAALAVEIGLIACCPYNEHMTCPLGLSD